MTVLTKPSIVIRKGDAMRDPLVLGEVCEEKIDIHHPTPKVYSPAKKSSLTLLFISSIAIMVGITGLTCGLMIYKQYLKNNSLRYQGFCNVPIIDDDDAAALMIDVRDLDFLTTEFPDAKQTQEQDWHSLEFYKDPRHVPFATVFNLQEEFDIGDSIEKIKVKNQDRTVTYIHDFSSNRTGIIDPERCFLMSLDNRNVLSPDVFVVSIENKDNFDLSVVRNTLRAVMPALSQVLANNFFGNTCDNKPIYELKRQSKSVIRKRSPGLPPATYVHFAGKGIQEVEISNLADLLAYEKKHA